MRRLVLVLCAIVLSVGCSKKSYDSPKYYDTAGEHPESSQSSLHPWEADEDRPIYELRTYEKRSYAIITTRAMVQHTNGLWHRWSRRREVWEPLHSTQMLLLDDKVLHQGLDVGAILESHKWKNIKQDLVNRLDALDIKLGKKDPCIDSKDFRTIRDAIEMIKKFEKEEEKNG